jgi:predicted nucleic acid-binding protein
MMITRTPEHAVALLGRLAATLALGLVVLGLTTGNSHAAIRIDQAALYAAQLLARATLLRVDVALDLGFLLVYTAFLTALYATLRRWSAPDGAPALWLGALLVSALLDAVEDAHVLAMLAQAEHGIAIPDGQIAAQMLISELKLVTSYAGLMMLSFALPEGTRLERAVVGFLRWIHPVLGIAVLVVPSVWLRPLLLLRFAGLIGALWAFASIVRVHTRARRAGR